MTHTAIFSDKAPAAIGTYSQAIKAGKMVFISGQIALNAEGSGLISDNFSEQAKQVFSQIDTLAQAAGGSLADITKLTIYITDFANFAEVNALMAEVFPSPYPARATVQVSALPKQAKVEIDAIMILD
jgi:reactive intermediate/imine deaminase